MQLKVKCVYSSLCEPISELLSVTCHVWDHSLTCHLTSERTLL